MKKFKALVALLLTLMLVMVFAACTPKQHGCENKCPQCGKCTDAACTEDACKDKCAGHKSDDTEAPVITVTGVPETGMIGDTITIPAATAQDVVDGDVSANIKVTVSLLKEDGDISRDLIYQKAGNVEQTFTASSTTLFTYKISYEVKDAAGNRAKAEFTLTVQEDKQTGTLTLGDSTVAANGLTGQAGKDILLPAAVAIDQPGDKNISNLIQARLYEVVNGEPSTIVFTSWEDFSVAKTVRIPAGTYQIVYSVKDAAGNKFPDEIKFNITVSAPKGNLLNDKNFAMDWDDKNQEYKEGMSWVSKYGEICFGHTAALPNIDQMVGVTSNVTKIHEQYVALTFNADSNADPAGEMFYIIAGRGSKNANVLPNKETCTWPPYLTLRLNGSGIEPKAAATPDVDMQTVKAYTGPAYFDGKDHTLYIQWRNVGESATAEGAAIYCIVWLDTVPTENFEESASFIAKVVPGEATAWGTIENSEFARLWDENTGAGWFSMSCHPKQGSNHADDYMRIKGFAIYDKDTTDFNLDIKPPVVSASGFNAIYATNEEITLPIATADDGSAVKCYIVDATGNRTEVINGKYTPTAIGDYTIVYEATDAAGNLGYYKVAIKVADRDTVAPELTLGNDAQISATVGQEITLPTATANDNQDGDITAKIQVVSIGNEYVTGLTAGGKYTPMTAGTQTIYYTVVDAFGNTTEKTVTVVVASAASSTGDLLNEAVTIVNGTPFTYRNENIYDQKISAIVNVTDVNGVYMFGVRGPVDNTDWPQSVVLRLTNNGVDISAKGHDGAIFGNHGWEAGEYVAGQDMLLEFEIKNVVVSGVEYVRVRLWINGKSVGIWDQTGNNYNRLEDENMLSVYKPLDDFVALRADSIYSTPLHIAVYNGSMTLKQLRIDGTSCEYAAPDAGEKEGENILESAVTVSSGNGYTTPENVTGEKISMIVNVSDTSLRYQFNIRGDYEGNADWPKGLVIRFTQQGYQVFAQGCNDSMIFGQRDWETADGYEANKDMLLEFQVRNVTIDGTEYVRICMWLNGKPMYIWGCAHDAKHNLEEGVIGGYITKAKLAELDAGNVDYTPMTIGSDSGVIIIKELRIDGTSCKIPE